MCAKNRATAFQVNSILTLTGHPSRETFPRLPPQILSSQNTKVKQTSGRSMFLGKDLITHKLWYFGSISGRPPPFSPTGFRSGRKLSAQWLELAAGKKKKNHELTTYSSS